jgi:hypothetical protein
MPHTVEKRNTQREGRLMAIMPVLAEDERGRWVVVNDNDSKNHLAIYLLIK